MESVITLPNSLRDSAFRYVISTLRRDLGRRRRDLSLASGKAGTLLLANELRSAFPSSKLADTVATLAHDLRSCLQDPLAPDSLFGGKTGAWWSLSRLDDAEDAVNCEASAAYGLDSARRIAQGDAFHFELVHGLSGIGLAGLASPTPDLAAAAVTHLWNSAQKDADGIFWRTPRSLIRNPHFLASGLAHFDDLGLAHGQGGPLLFISDYLALGRGCHADRIQLQQASNWLLRQRTADGFPYLKSLDGPARLGWCYGDLGCCVALARVSAVLCEPSFSQAIVELVTKCSRRIPSNESVTDIGLCHGVFGAALLFDHLACLLQVQEASIAAKQWWDHGIDILERLNWDPASHPRGLLEGATGIALLLLNSLSLSRRGWALPFIGMAT